MVFDKKAFMESIKKNKAEKYSAENIASEDVFKNSGGEQAFQMSYEEYASGEKIGFYYSLSTPEQQTVWDHVIRVTDELYPVDILERDRDKIQESGDLLDHTGLIHHWGCIYNGLDNIRSYHYEELSDEDKITFDEAMKMWMGYYNKSLR